jgi:hypothetical protein
MRKAIWKKPAGTQMVRLPGKVCGRCGLFGRGSDCSHAVRTQLSRKDWKGSKRGEEQEGKTGCGRSLPQPVENRKNYFFLTCFC